MTEHVSSSSSSSSSSANDIGMTIDIRPMIEDVSQVMTKHITNILSGVIGEYTVYKETHDTIMGLPCVRRLQERINELEMPRDNSGCESNVASECSGGGVGGGGRGGCGAASRKDEIHQLQSAIAELNRYIVALESKVDMKTVYSSPASVANQEEESIRLEIHENMSENTESEFVIPHSNSKNVIISSSTIPEEPEEDDEATETTEDLASLVETVQVEIDAEGDEEAEEEEGDEGAAEANQEDPEANEETEAADNADADEDEAEEEEAADEEAADEEAADEEAADEEAAEEEAEEEEAEEEEAEEEEAADEEAADEEAADEEAADEEAADEEEEETAEEEEAEIEVSEVKIKGKTYFTTDPQNGIIYACVDDDVGDEVGVFKNGVAVFNKGKK